ncbi:MAG: hypothetical protein OXQ94_03715 [Gemmatimonadota bacterium]|nr:hypothetical protein [Gemmatimonadota bacterium]MDE2870784.1 hypothetical protein [Gemmatimonadota bacterium]
MRDLQAETPGSPARREALSSRSAGPGASRCRRSRRPVDGLRAPTGTRAIPFAVLVLAVVAAPLPGQVRIGGHGLYRNEIVRSQFGAGARAEVDLGFVMPHLALGAVYNHFFQDCEECRSWEAGGQATLGAGAGYIGLNVVRSRFEEVAGDRTTRSDDWKFSVVVGFRLLGLPVVVPFLEARQSLGSDALNDQSVSLGIMIGPARARSAPRAPGRR